MLKILPVCTNKVLQMVSAVVKSSSVQVNLVGISPVSRIRRAERMRMILKAARAGTRSRIPHPGRGSDHPMLCTQFLDFGYTLNYNVNIIICKKSTLWGAQCYDTFAT